MQLDRKVKAKQPTSALHLLTKLREGQNKRTEQKERLDFAKEFNFDEFKDMTKFYANVVAYTVNMTFWEGKKKLRQSNS